MTARSILYYFEYLRIREYPTIESTNRLIYFDVMVLYRRSHASLQDPPLRMRARTSSSNWSHSPDDNDVWPRRTRLTRRKTSGTSGSRFLVAHSARAALDSHVPVSVNR